MTTKYQPCFKSQSHETKRNVKSPKLYFTDTGLLCSLLGLREQSVADYANIGMIWEALVFSRLRKKELNFNEGNKLWFYRDNLGVEVDFSVENGCQVALMETKWTECPDKKSVQPMVKLEGKLSNISFLKVACRTPSAFPVDEAQAFNGLLHSV